MDAAGHGVRYILELTDGETKVLRAALLHRIDTNSTNIDMSYTTALGALHYRAVNDSKIAATAREVDAVRDALDYYLIEDGGQTPETKPEWLKDWFTLSFKIDAAAASLREKVGP